MSAVTRPTMVPAKRVRMDALRVCISSEKYQRQYNSTATPIQVTINPNTHCTSPMRTSSETPSAGIHSTLST
ncbi:hypothetical protein [Tessaracoccus caeni]|uniref:hypothetical protein n=1 Tax=Tessaracoccus caeni TaxID=3031239 RepID=UPI0023DBBCBB|nr:hypothetical protein [Tessaracoccus caeni]MDF1487321.1 hypothetical protein [Tessaracoccus caeni]